jgi:hypothetical protein
MKEDRTRKDKKKKLEMKNGTKKKEKLKPCKPDASGSHL